MFGNAGLEVCAILLFFINSQVKTNFNDILSVFAGNDNIMPRLIQLILVVVVSAVVFAGCGQRTQSKPIVTVSIEPQRYMLERIVGDLYDVRSLLSAGSDPENYDPSFTNLLNTRNSVAYLSMGNIGFEAAVVGKIHNENPELKIFNTSEGIDLIEGTHANGEADPHTWSSVRNARVIVANMTRAMCEIDPDHRELFERNGGELIAELDSVDGVFRLKLEAMRGQAFLVWHPSLSYFARDYGLRQIALGGSEHKELSIPVLQRNIDEARQSGATVMFVEKDTDSRQAAGANERIGARLVEIKPLDYEWLTGMESIVNEIAGENE